MDRIEDESLWLFCPSFADGLLWREALQGLQSSSKIIGADEVGEVGAELVVRGDRSKPQIREFPNTIG